MGISKISRKLYNRQILTTFIRGGWWGGGGGLGSQNFQSGESDLQRIFLICTRVVDIFRVFRGKHFMTSPLHIVTSYYIGSLPLYLSPSLSPPSLSPSLSLSPPLFLPLSLSSLPSLWLVIILALSPSLSLSSSLHLSLPLSLSLSPALSLPLPPPLSLSVCLSLSVSLSLSLSLSLPLSLSPTSIPSLSLSLSLPLSLPLPSHLSLSPSLSLPLSLSLFSPSISLSLSLSLVRWRYLPCCAFDAFSPSFPIVRQLWCCSNVQLRPFFQILEPSRCWSGPSPLAFHLSLHLSFLHTFRSSITPQFESITTLFVATCLRPWFTAVNGYGKNSGPKETYFESQTHTSTLPYRHHVLHCYPIHRQPPLDFLCTTAFGVDKGS